MTCEVWSSSACSPALSMWCDSGRMGGDTSSLSAGSSSRDRQLTGCAATTPGEQRATQPRISSDACAWRRAASPAARGHDTLGRSGCAAVRWQYSSDGTAYCIMPYSDLRRAYLQYINSATEE
eukprot:352421-Chlamydomonas_euryale.AAC.31